MKIIFFIAIIFSFSFTQDHIDDLVQQVLVLLQPQTHLYIQLEKQLELVH